MGSQTSYLSKSLFLRGLQCHKSLFLKKYHPEFSDKISQSQEMLFQSGTNVGLFARQRFQDGIEIPFENLSITEQIDLTVTEINRGSSTLYEAAFSYDEVFVKVDILHKGKSGWEIYEVKSSTEIKDINIFDLAVQYYVLKGSGLPISKASLVHINNEYVREGYIEVNKLFATQNLTDLVKEKQDIIIGELKQQKLMLSCEMPAIDIGEHCSDPYECDFQGYCWKHIPEESIFSLRGRGIDKFEFYRNGIIGLKELNPEVLNDQQRMQLEAALQKKNFINREGIREFLDSLWYPLYFLDFETFMTPIPPFDGTKPYQQIPFQYSLHYIPDKTAVLGHHEFLASQGIDPREALLQKLLIEIPDNACVLAYNSSFERNVLESLRDSFPQYKEKIERIVNNMRDLMVPFRNRDVYFWQMNGSYSIKAVLPVLVPDLSYGGLEISDGGMAMEAYFKMCKYDDPVEIQKNREALLAYCGLDSLAMVRILNKLIEIVSE